MLDAHHLWKQTAPTAVKKAGTPATLKSLISFTIIGKPVPLKRHRSTRTGKMLVLGSGTGKMDSYTEKEPTRTGGKKVIGYPTN